MKNFFSLYTWIVLLGICLFRANCEEAKPPEEKDQEWRLCTLYLKSGITFKGLVLDDPKMTVQYDNGGMILPFDRDKVEKIEPLSAEEAEQVLIEISKRRGWTEELKRVQKELKAELERKENQVRNANKGKLSEHFREDWQKSSSNAFDTLKAVKKLFGEAESAINMIARQRKAIPVEKAEEGRALIDRIYKATAEFD